MAAAALLLSGCGYAPGDYIVYRLVLTEEGRSAGCYHPLPTPPPDLEEDSSTLGTSATWVLYFAAGDRMVLDIETTTLAGAEGDERYEFEAYTVDTSYQGADEQETKITVVQRKSVEMTVEGTAMEGRLSDLTTTECRPLSAEASPSLCTAEIPDCSRSWAFVGVQLVDVDLESELDPSSPTPTPTPTP